MCACVSAENRKAVMTIFCTCHIVMFVWWQDCGCLQNEIVQVIAKMSLYSENFPDSSCFELFLFIGP
jgi:hypothetical protein